MDRYPIEELLKNISKIISKYSDLYKILIHKYPSYNNFHKDPLNLQNLLFKAFNKVFTNPDLMIKYQMSFFKGQLAAIENIYQLVYPDNIFNFDKRFKDNLWQEHSVFIWLKEAYLTYAEWLESIMNDLPKSDFSSLELKRLHFIIKQFLDAISPSNFPSTNPEVLKTFFDTAGENLSQGLDNLLRDIENSKNALQIRNNDGSKFILGENIAKTEGKIVFQNEIMQLIHYKPLTKEQYSVPILIIPPFINKYYILDLQEENSFVKWLLEQNYNVFLISWVNPDSSLAQASFVDYMQKGPLAALDYLSQTLNIKQVNAMGYCIGGTLLTATIAYMKNLKDNRIKTFSLFTTLIDFEDAGDLSIFIDETFINEAAQYIEKSGGYVEGKDMSTIFSLLKSNDMIWPFYINNYLLGKDVFPFDILYWNEDSTRIPMALHLFCLEKLYKDNLLKQPNALTINKQKIDVSKIDIPCFSIAAKSDHLVPWSKAFDSAKLLSGPVTFVLTDSGHVAGMVNPPSKNKYCYWSARNDKKYSTKEWFDNSLEHKGSWWPYWHNWAKQYSGNLIQAQLPEIINPNVIESAPGSYVRVREI
jgi:polyhydroxyalkanoate synthase